MKKIIPVLILTPALLIGCGMSDEEKANVAAVTCSVMSETRNMDAAVRVREINAAREKIGEAPYLNGDEGIKQSFEFGLCEELVLNDPTYDQKSRMVAERIAKAEEERRKEERKRNLERQAREAKERAEREARRAKERAERKAREEEERRRKEEERRVREEQEAKERAEREALAAEKKRKEEQARLEREAKEAEEKRLEKERNEKFLKEIMEKFRCPKNPEERTMMIRLALDTGNTELYRRVNKCW